ncbi:MAG: hypothetical protein LE180_04135 [Endomicrobium sp.]|uniref:restriction endonuclease n=1 Tax=Candidatus Endomicrobiellum pyrsonymphae TaxID=1408203 RepID=UPI0035823A5C|nr:hypothetical protein [Endomicrobium sp.]
MNYWMKLSIEYANQRNYLDDLFKVYPTVPEGIRDIDNNIWNEVEKAFKKKDNIKLLKNLFEFDLFPIKDSYVAYLKRDISALERNPATISRLSGRLYEMGLNKIYEHCSEPKETNRQIGPLFKRWLKSKVLGVELLKLDRFLKTKENAVLDASDEEMKSFAKEKLNYKHDNGLDFVAYFNGKYVIGEAKFLIDFGEHQNAQFNDAIATIKTKNVNAVKIAILDGVLYIKDNNKMHMSITGKLKGGNIMSSLVLREFLYQL